MKVKAYIAQFCHAAARLKPVPSLSCPEDSNGGRAGSSSTGDVRAGLPRDFRRDKHQPGDPASSGRSHVAVHLMCTWYEVTELLCGWMVDRFGKRRSTTRVAGRCTQRPEQTESVSGQNILCSVHSVGQCCVAHVQ